MFDGRSLPPVIVALLLAGQPLGTRAAAQSSTHEAVGPSRCVRCHPKEAQWLQTLDGPPPKAHLSALAQLETPEAGRYAGRLGIADVFDVRGSCVTCHATVFRGQAREGVSCESCHGPGSAYLDPHAQLGAYRVAVSAGMVDMIGNVKAWTARCVNCHLIVDRSLVAAGHSSGASFDLADKYRIVSPHWKRTYPAADVAAAARDAAAAITALPHGR